MKNNILFFFLFFFSFLSFSQQEITWHDLSKIKFTKKYFKEYDDYFMYPEFLPSVKALESKKITIKGYFLDLGIGNDTYVLSKGPMSSCYFCGQGGPETAIELQFTNSSNFKTDAIVAVTGILKLNQNDVDHFNYILTDCTGVLVK